MSLEEQKITGYASSIASLPDQVQGRAEWLKKMFDARTDGEVKEKHNGLVDALTCVKAGESGAGQIGVSPIEGAEGANVQAVLEELQAANSAGRDETLRRVIAGSESAKYLRVNADRVIETSADGAYWQATGSSGHIIEDGDGRVMPQRGRMRFAETDVEDDGEGTTVVKGLGVRLADRAPVPGVPLHAQLVPVGVAPPVPLDGRADGATIQTDPVTGVWRAMYSNPNLLDNSDFTDPVNQRGMESPFFPGYCIDRWINQTHDGGRCGLLNGGISFTAPGGTLKQILPKALGTDVTPSLGVLSGEYNVSASYDDSTRTFTITATGNCTIEWAKLERGSVATPYVPKGYGAELAECRRYFERFKFSEGTDMARQISYSRHINMGATLCTFTVEITPKRALPSIGPFGNICVYIGDTQYAVANAHVNGYDKDSKLILIAVTIDKPNETSNNDSRLCLKGLSPGCYFDISCDL